MPSERTVPGSPSVRPPGSAGRRGHSGTAATSVAALLRQLFRGTGPSSCLSPLPLLTGGAAPDACRFCRAGPPTTPPSLRPGPSMARGVVVGAPQPSRPVVRPAVRPVRPAAVPPLAPPPAAVPWLLPAVPPRGANPGKIVPNVPGVFQNRHSRASFFVKILL